MSLVYGQQRMRAGLRSALGCGLRLAVLLALGGLSQAPVAAAREVAVIGRAAMIPFCDTGQALRKLLWVRWRKPPLEMSHVGELR